MIMMRSLNIRVGFTKKKLTKVYLLLSYKCNNNTYKIIVKWVR